MVLFVLLCRHIISSYYGGLIPTYISLKGHKSLDRLVNSSKTPQGHLWSPHSTKGLLKVTLWLNRFITICLLSASKCHSKAMFYFWVGILLCSSNNGMSNLKFPLSIMSVFDQFTSRLNLITSSYFYFTNFQLFFSKSKLRRSTVRVSIFYVNLFRQQAAFHRSLALSYSGLHFLGC